jgi:aminoacyl tRNA synthase complex-interacting multifunctional protein 1
LTTSSGEVSSLPEVAVALFEAGGKSNDALGASDEDKKDVKSWLSRIGEGQFEKEEGVKARFLPSPSGAAQQLTERLQTLDGELRARTYLVGETVTAADLSLVAALHPYIVRSLLSPFPLSPS